MPAIDYDTKRCVQCGATGWSRDARWDAYYCRACHAWQEGRCNDRECRYCAGRPHKHQRAAQSFNIGDCFAKKENAGFVGERLPYCIIPDVEENRDPPPCFVCDDDACREYPTCYVLTADGGIDGAIYHVSECQMEALPTG